ncbi:MAG: hypothetical protein Q9221_001980 [Calogaya cf. arnoldii]
MLFLQSLFLATSLSAVTHAAPSLLSTSTRATSSHLRKREVSGVTPQGVNCATANEPLHSLSAEVISKAVESGTSYASPREDGYRYLPHEFNPSEQLADPQTVASWAAGCDVTKPLYYFPIGYGDKCFPQTRMKGAVPPPSCNGRVTPDVVVFNAEYEMKNWAGIPGPYSNWVTRSANYCATLTNSDTPASGLGLSFAKYRQCMNNEA